MATGSKARAPRYLIRGMRIIYDTGEAFWTAPVLDCSESGMFVETEHELPAGMRVVIMPDVDGEVKLPFEIRAEVVRVNELDLDNFFDRIPGIAFRLVGVSLEHFAQLRSFLKDHGTPVRRG